MIRVGNSLIGFLSELLVFCENKLAMSDLLKKTSDLLIRSFLVSNLSDSLISLIQKEGMSELLIFFKKCTKHTKNMILFKIFERIANFCEQKNE